MSAPSSALRSSASRHRGRKVITVHDLFRRHYPDVHPAARVMALNRAVLLAAAESAGLEWLLDDKLLR